MATSNANVERGGSNVLKCTAHTLCVSGTQRECITLAMSDVSACNRNV